jgi:ataxia telangiectasia mutated family protein
VDGLGPTGTEGTFARSAASTLAVLRDNANALLTILSAIASDPLYRWSVSPVEARRRQRLTEEGKAPTKSSAPQQTTNRESKSERNEAAALALAKIQEKLQGYEEGASGEQQSIEGQVQLLFNSARDPDNLCLMFGGWAPWV